ncbi:restriction endonuclease subunit S [Roseburia sp. OF03-24]|jgi:type I restriction enzyme S subunit|uniref:restriction endonuclease subunit S n=1 Tax=Roseburia sp. OF03-24 TaxID=2292367 RepID=UPI000E494D5F|nr:restriction endonuclease subunit S [Roseburia sp. OF03-24]RGX94532.1 restriction endonuclease subunit S [Roseburia sp. OF03-24]
MEEIKRIQLSEIADLITKGTTPTTLGYEFKDEGVNFLKIECFDENGAFLESKVTHISEECHKKLKRSQLKAGDVLFSIAGAIGRVAIVTEEMIPANTNQALAIIRISDEQVYLPYIKLILTSPIVIEQFERKKQGVAQLNLSLKDINEISIPLPNKDKQIELAELFDKVADIIVKRNMELTSLDNLIQARFVEMFGDPVQNTKGWNIDTCKNLTSKIGSGATPKGGRESYGTEGISLIRSMNVYNNRFEYKDLAYITDEQADKLSNVTIEENDVLLNITGASVARCCAVPKELIPARVNQHVAIVRCKDRLLPEFLCSMFTEDSYQRLLWSIATSGGATREAITKQQIEDLVLIVPPIELQQQFVDFCKQVNKLKLATSPQTTLAA